MSETVEFYGLDPKDAGDAGTIAAALMMLKYAAGDPTPVLDEIGTRGRDLTTQKLLKNRVKPPTTDAVLELRRKAGQGKYDGITLVDTGLGMRMVSYKVNYRRSVDVGVPDGYMAYHEQGRVPNAPRRRFLTMPPASYIYKVIKWHWRKALRKAR